MKLRLRKLRLRHEAALVLSLALLTAVTAAATSYFAVLSFGWIAWVLLGYAAVAILGHGAIAVVQREDLPEQRRVSIIWLWVAAISYVAFWTFIVALTEFFTLKWWILLVSELWIINLILDHILGPIRSKPLDWDTIERAFEDVRQVDVFVPDHVWATDAEAMAQVLAASVKMGRTPVGCLSYTKDGMKQAADEAVLPLQLAVVPGAPSDLAALTEHVMAILARPPLAVTTIAPGRLEVRMRG